jgi:hypothetical protein
MGIGIGNITYGSFFCRTVIAWIYFIVQLNWSGIFPLALGEYSVKNDFREGDF